MSKKSSDKKWYYLVLCDGEIVRAYKNRNDAENYSYNMNEDAVLCAHRELDHDEDWSDQDVIDAGFTAEYYETQPVLLDKEEPDEPYELPNGDEVYWSEIMDAIQLTKKRGRRVS